MRRFTRLTLALFLTLAFLLGVAPRAHADDDTPREWRITRYDARVDVAADGIGAVRAVEAAPYDLVLMDVQMPRLDGMMATRLIRCIDSLKHIPIIFLSGHAGRKHRERAACVSNSEYLVKPLDTQLLINTLTRLLGIKAINNTKGKSQ